MFPPWLSSVGSAFGQPATARFYTALSAKDKSFFDGQIAHVHGETGLRFPALTEPSSNPPTSGASFAAAERLRIDAATAEVLGAFDAAGVDCVLLKGPTLTSWLYPEVSRRSYVDSDLLGVLGTKARPKRRSAALASNAVGINRRCRTGGRSTGAIGGASPMASRWTCTAASPESASIRGQLGCVDRQPSRPCP